MTFMSLSARLGMMSDDKSFEMRDKYFDKIDQSIVDTFVTQSGKALSIQ